MTLLITIDTEADDQWQHGGPSTTRNIDFIPAFQSLCDRFGFPPTYLCTYNVVASPSFDSVLLPYASTGVAELGAHLHPWTTPPFDPHWDASDRGYPYASEIPTDLFACKLDNLTTALQRKLGRGPTSYRAGRWGFSSAHVAILLRLGYIVDCSVTPLLSWRDGGARERGQDYTDAPVRPYFMAWGDPAREGSSDLLEVPVTIVQTNRLMQRSPLMRAAYQRRRKWAAAKALNRVFRIAPQWFRPFADMTAERLISVYNTAKRLRLPAIEMAFHSSELMPGGSPHNPTAESVERLLKKLEKVFGHLASDGVTGTTLTAFAETYRSGRTARM